ncbi:MAG: YdcF family protein [Clostridiales bacterium]|nr:YdcF family protein [Clostridiales bacterium]
MRKVLITLSFILIAIAGLTIFNIYMIGDEYTFRVGDVLFKESDRPGFIFENKGVVKVIDQNVIGDKLYLTVEGIAPGETGLTVTKDENSDQGVFYTDFTVHSFNIVTQDGFFGTFNNIEIVFFESIIILFCLLILSIMKLIREKRESYYSYGIVFALGMTIFISFSLIYYLIVYVVSYGDGMQSYEIFSNMLSIFGNFTFILFPVMFILSVWLIITNINLMKHEGRGVTNALGIIIGVLICLGTILGNTFYYLLTGFSIGASYEVYVISLYIESVINLVLSYFECMLIANMICTFNARRHIPQFNKDYMIILGCRIRKDGTLTPLLRGRADRAIWFYNEQLKNTGKQLKFVASGGQGADEIISEGAAIRNYLLEQGIPDELIIVEDKSANTEENMANSRELILADWGEKLNLRVSFSTTGYHVFRSGIIANDVGIKASGIGSKTKWYYYFNASLREFIAGLYFEKNRHIFNIAVMFVVVTVLFIFGNHFQLF